jgi:carbonic anhydrase
VAGVVLLAIAAVRPAAEQIQSNDVMTAAERQTALERVSIRNSLNNLRSFPDIKALEEAGKIALHGAWFDISTGELWVMDAETLDFIRPEV